MESSDTFWNLGHTITRHNVEGSLCLGYRTFRAFFGTSPQVCALVWNGLSTRPPNSKPEYLLWGLMLLKQYNIESVNATLTGVTEKTFRKWSLTFVRLLGHHSVVNVSDIVYQHISLITTFYFYTDICLTGKAVSITL